MTIDNTTIATQGEWIKITPIFFVEFAKNVFFGVLQNFTNWFMCAVR